MAIKLSLNKTLYSYDGQLEAYVTDTTVVKVQIYTGYDLSDSVLVYQQGDVKDSVAIINNVAEIPGMNLRSGQLSVAVLYDNTLSNFVQIYATKAAALSQNLVDDDPYFTVDRNKRLVSVPGTQDMIAVNFDENSEVITFKFPRYADGVDLSTKEIYVNYERSDKTRNKALCTLTDTSDSYVVFTWVVSAYATQVEGTLNFNIEFRSVDYRWQTQPTSLLVYRSLLYTGEAVPDQPELLDQYLDMFAELNSHPPIPGDNGYWRIWSLDTHSYETSEFPLQAGKDGITPTIGENGNWYLGATDTGKPSRGATGAPGKDGNSPVVTATKSGKTTTISVDGAAIATVEDGADGAPGSRGSDGITPTIGQNGNWYIGAEDTGKPSRGETGPQGTPGIYYGTTQPTGDTHPVWIDPDGDHDDGGLLPAVTAADNGKVLRVVSSAWTAADMPSGGTGGSGGETWELVAEATTTDVVNSMRVTFDACSAVYVEFCWGGVENDLGDIAIYPNQGDTPYAGEKRAAAAYVKSSTSRKRGMLCVRMDCRVGTYWTAVSNQKSRGDGAFGSVNADNLLNIDIGVDPDVQYSVIHSGYMTIRDDTPASGVKSITAYGAGMAIGTRIKVWGIKK